MTETKDVATFWLQGLAARGVRVSVRNNRIWLHPSSAYKSLADEELLTLRHHRAAIKACINSGVSFDVVRTAPAAEKTTPVPEPPCKWCYRSPCIGDQHPAFYTLHPLEAQKREDRRLNDEFRLVFGMSKLP